MFWFSNSTITENTKRLLITIESDYIIAGLLFIITGIIGLCSSRNTKFCDIAAFLIFNTICILAGVALICFRLLVCPGTIGPKIEDLIGVEFNFDEETKNSFCSVNHFGVNQLFAGIAIGVVAIVNGIIGAACSCQGCCGCCCCNCCCQQFDPKVVQTLAGPTKNKVVPNEYDKLNI